MYRTEKTKELVLKGIPESMRGELWLLFSGEEKFREARDKRELSKAHAEPTVLQMIQPCTECRPHPAYYVLTLDQNTT